MSKPQVVNATREELDELLALARAASFPPEKYQLLEAVLDSFVYVMQLLQGAKSSLRRFQQMLFGARTESKANVLNKNTGGEAATQPEPTADPPEPSKGDQAVVASQELPAEPAAVEGKRAGHGRNGAQAYQGATVVAVEHPSLQPGMPCPECLTGKVYAHEPRVLVRMVGQPPIAATVYQIERLRCRMCDAVFSAPIPEGVGADRYDESCASMIAMLRYGSGMPFFRLEGLQANLHVPLPDATQWDIVLKRIPGPRLAFAELVRQSAQAELLHNDDTPMKIQALMKAAKSAPTEEDADTEPSEARAVNTSGIVALLGEHKIALFLTGPKHAGENLVQVLSHRAKDLATPIQMCDPLSRNYPEELKTVLAKCLAHGRRKFVEIVEHFPEHCVHVIDVLAEVYRHDAYCRDQKFSPEQRLVYHQEHSGPLMQALKTWMQAQLDQRLVEGNSGLGQALRYMIKHWHGLTQFLRVAGAPLDNNICEKALKKAILHRKNSMFYRSLRGAEVGDIYMSLIYTCQLCGVNPFEYLQALQVHADELKQNAHLWLPWNYHERLADSS